MIPLETTVAAEALYVARFVPDAAHWPFWLLRRYVVPYVAARQYLVLRRDGVPIAFAGWAYERPDTPAPWRADRYLPARGEITGPGRACVTQILSGFLPPVVVAEAVGRHLQLPVIPPFLERDAQGRFVQMRNDPCPPSATTPP